jgi:hypothetical protein
MLPYSLVIIQQSVQKYRLLLLKRMLSTQSVEIPQWTILHSGNSLRTVFCCQYVSTILIFWAISVPRPSGDRVPLTKMWQLPPRRQLPHVPQSCPNHASQEAVLPQSCLTGDTTIHRRLCCPNHALILPLCCLFLEGTCSPPPFQPRT